MQVGSIVEAVVCFDQLKAEWPSIKYPNKGDVLTVADIGRHPAPEVDRLGILLLRFEELDNPFGICDRQIDGTVNFVELLPPVCLEAMLVEELEFA